VNVDPGAGVFLGQSPGSGPVDPGEPTTRSFDLLVDLLVQQLATPA
jgi:hypothetical protein